MIEYDYIIVGAGPSGLTCAYYLGITGKKVLLLDREASIGGCHRVFRIKENSQDILNEKGLFCEHGPRIIIDNYFSLKQILSDFNKNSQKEFCDIKFEDLYNLYDFSTNTSAKDLFAVLSAKEIFLLITAFLKFCVNEEWSRNTTVLEFCMDNKFSRKSKEYMDKVCRLSDGGTYATYTLYEFLQIFNQNFFYNVYQPKLPNDVGLFKIWENALINTKNVTIKLNSEITYIGSNYVSVGDVTYQGKNFIFAIPPTPMLSLLQRGSFDTNIFGDFKSLYEWSKPSTYLVYIPITFHWNKKLKLPNKHNLPESYYGIVHVVMSDYMDFNDSRSLTVIVCTVKSANTVSPRNNKTANQCTKGELISEVYEQLVENQPGLNEPPQFSLMDPNVYKKVVRPTSKSIDNLNVVNKIRGVEVWDTKDTAYFFTKAGYVSNTSEKYNNFYWVGTHNGNSTYSFTSMESAMQNAIYLLNKLGVTKIALKEPFTMRKILGIFITFIIVICLYYFFVHS